MFFSYFVSIPSLEIKWQKGFFHNKQELNQQLKALTQSFMHLRGQNANAPVVVVDKTEGNAT